MPSLSVRERKAPTSRRDGAPSEGLDSAGEVVSLVRSSSARHLPEVVLTFVAQTLLWTMTRKSLLTAPFAGLDVKDSSIASLVLIAAVVVMALACGAVGERVRIAHSSRFVVPVGLCGGFAILLGIVVLGDGSLMQGSVPLAWALVCVCVEAFSFCIVYFAWIRLINQQVFTWGLGFAVTMQLLAIATSIVVAPMYGEGIYAAAIDVAILPLAAACYAFVCRMRGCDAAGEGIEDSEGVVAAKEVPGRARLWLFAAGATLFLVVFISYLPYIGEGVRTESGEDILSYGLTFALFVVFAAVSLRSEGAVARRDRVRPVAVLCAVLVIVLLLFLFLFSVLGGEGLAFSLARFIRRISRAIVFLFVMVVVYRFNAPALSAFAFAYLAPGLAPKVLMFVTDVTCPVVNAMEQFGDACLVMLGMGSAVVMILIVICLLGFDGTLVRLAFGGTEDEHRPADESRAREVACGEIAKAAHLTKREQEILLYFSMGWSIQKVSEELSISRGTINTHSVGLYRKLDIHSRQELIDCVDDKMRQLLV